MNPLTGNDLNLKLKFKDFYPEVSRQGSIFKAAQYETLQSALDKMNEWIRKQSNIRVVQIETVVLPNMHLKREEGSEDPELLVHEVDGYTSRWHQFFRLWYE